MTATFALRRVDHLLLVLQCYCVALVYVNYVDTLMSDLLSGVESRTELQKSLLESNN